MVDCPIAQTPPVAGRLANDALPNFLEVCPATSPSFTTFAQLPHTYCGALYVLQRSILDLLQIANRRIEACSAPPTAKTAHSGAPSPPCPHQRSHISRPSHRPQAHERGKPRRTQANQLSRPPAQTAASASTA